MSPVVFRKYTDITIGFSKWLQKMLSFTRDQVLDIKCTSMFVFLLLKLCLKKLLNDNLLALITHVLSKTNCLDFRITFMAQSTILITYKPTVRQFISAHLTSKTARMPVSCHSFDYTPNYELTALIAAWCEQNMEIPFAILSSLEFIENTILKGTETLGTTVTPNQK